MLKLELKGVSKKKKIKQDGRQKEILVLDDIDLQVDPGDIFTIIGPSGGGKSTFLRLLNRLEDVSSGSIFLDGKNIETLDVIELRIKVGLVFQVPVMFEENVAKNIFYPLKVKGENLSPMENHKEEIEECINWVDLDKSFLSRNSDELSVGEKQRVCIARALMAKPEVLLLDEPTSALDPTATLNIEKLILDLNKNLSLTIIFVTHNIAQALRLEHKCMVLVGGKKIEEGYTKDVFSNPQNELTKRFLEGNLKKEKI
jgi:putative ABC transport system ATP-binding protein